jgi:hypothetical protein
MKFISWLFLLIFGLCLISCNDKRNKWQNYDKGYEAGWEGGKSPSSTWISKEEKEGYEQGLDDAWMYDEGYYDGANKKKPKYFQNPFYMDGYKYGKKYK